MGDKREEPTQEMLEDAEGFTGRLEGDLEIAWKFDAWYRRGLSELKERLRAAERVCEALDACSSSFAVDEIEPLSEALEAWRKLTK